MVATTATTTTTPPTSPEKSMSETDIHEKNKTDDIRKLPTRCIEVWAIPPEVYAIKSKEERHKYIETLGKTTEAGPFPPNSLTTPAPISFLEEAAVLASLLVALGGPLVWVFGMLGLLLVGSWSQLVTAMVVSYALAYHPMPSHEYAKNNVITSWWTRALYKYFTYRFVWAGDSHEKIQEHRPWIGAGVRATKQYMYMYTAFVSYEWKISQPMLHCDSIFCTSI